jgi:hypothetical protein
MKFINKSEEEVNVKVYAEVQPTDQYKRAEATNVQPGATVDLAVVVKDDDDPEGYLVVVMSQGGNQIAGGPGRVSKDAKLTFTGKWELQVS